MNISATHDLKKKENHKVLRFLGKAPKRRSKDIKNQSFDW